MEYVWYYKHYAITWTKERGYEWLFFGTCS